MNEEDENVDNEEASSREEGGSQEESVEDSREYQNQDILDPITTEADKGGMSKVDK